MFLLLRQHVLVHQIIGIHLCALRIFYAAPGDLFMVDPEEKLWTTREQVGMVQYHLMAAHPLVAVLSLHVMSYAFYHTLVSQAPQYTLHSRSGTPTAAPLQAYSRSYQLPACCTL